MADYHDVESPVDRRAETVLFVIMVIGLGLSVVAGFMGHTNIAVALAGVGGIAMIVMFMFMIQSTFLPLPDLPMDDAPRAHRQEVEDRPTIH